MRSSTGFHSEENGQPSPSRKTPRATEETAFQDSSSRGVIPADGQGQQLRTSSSTTNIGAIDRVDHFYGGGATEDSHKSATPGGANDTLAPATVGGDGDGVTGIEDLTDSSDAAVSEKKELIFSQGTRKTVCCRDPLGDPVSVDGAYSCVLSVRWILSQIQL